jgi:hypothetical protein
MRWFYVTYEQNKIIKRTHEADYDEQMITHFKSPD